MGFLIETSFIIGFPWEDEKEINETYNLHCDLLSKGVFRSQIWVLCPLPGTELTKTYESELKWNNLKSRIALDDIQLDKFSSNLIISNQDMFSQFGYIDNNNLDWIEISATADAAYQLNNIYYNEKVNK
jgi:radical SAM superfamily enzyme YgiQ (UPF0313 family)